jgi:hypothetical protein
LTGSAGTRTALETAVLEKLKRLRSSKKLKILFVVFLVLFAARLALPAGLKWYVNRTLDRNPDYDGQVGDIDVHLWRGAYEIEGIKIVKTSGEVPVPFFEAKSLDLSIAWRELFRGAVVSELEFLSPQLNFVDAKAKQDKQTGEGQPWQETVKKLAPFRISHLKVKQGAIHFRNFQAKPPVDIWMKDIEGEANNLTNSKDLATGLFAAANASGTVMGDARFQLTLRLSPEARKPTFDLNAKIQDIKLPALNTFFEKYAKLDFESGDGDIVMEIAAKDGVLKGYVKPIFRRLDILSSKDVKEGDNIFQLAWQAIAGTIADLLKNRPKDQFATKIPIEGPIKKPDTDTLAAIGGVLRNAFILAFTPFYDDSVSLKEAE